MKAKTLFASVAGLIAVGVALAALAANKSQTDIAYTNCSAAMTTGTPVLVLAETSQRGALLLMNTGAATINFVFSPTGQGATQPTITAGASGVLALNAPAVAGGQGGSYEPSGGAIPQNAIWAKGTTGDTLVCYSGQ